MLKRPCQSTAVGGALACDMYIWRESENGLIREYQLFLGIKKKALVGFLSL